MSSHYQFQGNWEDFHSLCLSYLNAQVHTNILKKFSFFPTRHSFIKENIWKCFMQLNDVHHNKEFLTFNSLHPNISVNILETVLYTFPMVLTRRISSPINRFSRWWSFTLFLWPKCLIQQWYCKEKFDTNHSWGHSFILITLTCDLGVVL